MGKEFLLFQSNTQLVPECRDVADLRRRWSEILNPESLLKNFRGLLLTIFLHSVMQEFQEFQEVRVAARAEAWYKYCIVQGRRGKLILPRCAGAAAGGKAR
jgi:hypothetical protein